MKSKHVVVVFLLTILILLIGGQVRRHGVIRDIPVSQVLFAVAGFILAKKGVLKGKWKFVMLPFSIFFWYTFAFLFDNIFSNFENWQFLSIAAPNLLVWLLGATYGTLLASERVQKIIGVSLLAICAFFSAWYVLKGNEYWFNYISVGTFTGKITEDKTYNWYRPVDTSGVITEAGYKDKLVVLDFWNVNCGVCYRKFPQLDSLSRHYRNDTNIVFLAVNLPVEEDTTAPERVRLLKEKYAFRHVFADTAAARMFGIDGIPTVLIVRENRLLYRGSIELAAKYLAESRTELPKH